MKAQLSIDYIISLIIFISIAAYIFLRTASYTPPYINQIKVQRLKAEAYQISELLINDPGQPLDWNPANVERVGLSDHTKNETNFLSSNKITAFSEICTNSIGYDTMKSKIDTDYQFNITLKDRVTGNILIKCFPPQIVGKATKAEIRRIVAFDSSYGELIVQLW
jgi:hypothetical protein